MVVTFGLVFLFFFLLVFVLTWLVFLSSSSDVIGIGGGSSGYISIEWLIIVEVEGVWFNFSGKVNLLVVGDGGTNKFPPYSGFNSFLRESGSSTIFSTKAFYMSTKALNGLLNFSAMLKQSELLVVLIWTGEDSFADGDGATMGAGLLVILFAFGCFCLLNHGLFVGVLAKKLFPRNKRL